MKCPVCPEVTLLMSEKQGVEIDYCPTCRGVWLDRGELEKLIQLSASKEVSRDSSPRFSENDRYREKSYSDSDKYRHHGGHRSKSWLWEIFD